ncbi:Tripartite ATP-independent periplasmic transporter, DctQ component [compost metagenome]
MDMVVAKLPTAGKKICLVTGQIIMLYIVGLMFQGSWAQAVINADVSAPVSGLPMAIVYASGLVFSAMAGLIIAVDLYRVLAGKLKEQDLIMVQESEEAVQLKQILDDAQHGAPGRSA